MENFIRWVKRVVKRVAKFFIRLGKALAAWVRSRKPKKLSRKQKKRARKITDQKATGEMVAAAFGQGLREGMAQKPEPVTDVERDVFYETEEKPLYKKSVAPAIIPDLSGTEDEGPDVDDFHQERQHEIESLENQLQDTKAILRVTKHSKSRQKLQKRAADLEKRLKEFKA